MALIETLFSEYPDGTPADWTDFWGIGDFTATVESNAAGVIDFGTKWLKYETNADDRSVLTWDDLGSMSDVCVIAKIRNGVGGTTNGIRIYIRVGGVDTDEDAYFVAIGTTASILSKYKDGSNTQLDSNGFVLDSGSEYWIKFQAIGTAIKAKIWAADSVEPDEWHLEATDSDVASGAVGIGAYNNNQDFYLDYIGVDSSEINIPSSYTDDIYFGDCNIAISGIKSAFLNNSYAIGGIISTIDRKLKGVRVYCYGNHDDQIRIAVYSGGSLITGPQGATLLKDFGLTSGVDKNQYIEINTTDDIDIPVDTPLWIVLKGDNAAGFKMMFTNYGGNCGDYQLVNGRTSVEAIIGKDPDVAFAGTFPAGTDTFSAWWIKAGIKTGDLTTTTSTSSTSTSSTTTTTTSPPSLSAHLVTFVISS